MLFVYNKYAIQSIQLGEFPWGPVVRTLRFHFREPGSIPSQGTKLPHVAKRLSVQFGKFWCLHTGEAIATIKAVNFSPAPCIYFCKHIVLTGKVAGKTCNPDPQLGFYAYILYSSKKMCYLIFQPLAHTKTMLWKILKLFKSISRTWKHSYVDLFPLYTGK